DTRRTEGGPIARLGGGHRVRPGDVEHPGLEPDHPYRGPCDVPARFRPGPGLRPDAGDRYRDIAVHGGPGRPLQLRTLVETGPAEIRADMTGRAAGIVGKSRR